MPKISYAVHSICVVHMLDNTESFFPVVTCLRVYTVYCIVYEYMRWKCVGILEVRMGDEDSSPLPFSSYFIRQILE